MGSLYAKMQNSIFLFHSTLRVHPKDPPGGQAITPNQKRKKPKVLEFHFSRGHFYTKILNYVILFPSYLKGAPRGPPWGPEDCPIQKSTKYKVLRV